MLGGVTLYGLSVVAFAASPWFRLSMALMVIVGFATCVPMRLCKPSSKPIPLPNSAGELWPSFI